MSEIIHNHTLIYKGKKFEIKPIKRVLALGEATVRDEIDDYGFRRENFLLSRGGQRYSGDMLRMAERGGIIVGEGDIGKTWLVETLAAEDCSEMRVKTYKLRNYEFDRRELIDEARAFWDTCGEADSASAHLVLDGLDENEKAWQVIVEICNRVRNGKKCKVWVTGRPCHGMNELIKAECLKDQYHLLPFSTNDIRDLATMVGEDGDKFLRALKNKQVASYATKPGGATLLLKLYGAGKFSSCSRIQLTEEIAKSFARDGRDGCEVPANEVVYRDEDLMDGAAWIAARIFFSQRDSLWMGVAAECPINALSFSDLPRGKYKDDVLNAVTKRRLFEPLSTLRWRVAYDTSLMPFLVAYWIKTHTPRESIGTMLRTDKGIGKGMSEVMKYLCLYDPELGCGWIELSPKSFLDCPETIVTYGADKYYKLLEGQYLSLATFDYDAFIKGHAEQLLGQEELAKIALARLRSRTCDGRRAELAAMILRHTQMYVKESIEALVKFLEKSWLTLGALERHDLSYTLVGMLDGRDYDGLRRLKALLDTLEVRGEVDEGPKGNLLGLLWPKSLSTMELTEYLTRPFRENFGSSYKSFLSFTLPESFSKYVTRENIGPLLEWAAKNSQRECGQDTCGELSSQIFTYGWRWADDPEIARLLARCVVEYGKRDGYFHFSMPFYREHMYHKVDWLVSNLQCEKDKDKRFSVLESLLGEEGIGDDDYGNMFGLVQQYGLVYPGEFKAVYQLWEEYYNNEDTRAKANHLANLLETLSGWEPTDRSVVERKKLHALYPAMERFDIELLKKRVKRDDKFTAKWKADEESRKQKEEKASSDHLEMIRSAAKNGKMSDSGYLWFAEMVVSDKLRREGAKMDITQGCQWPKLTDIEKQRIREFAKECVTGYVPKKGLSMTGAHLFASGVYYLWNSKDQIPQKLPAKRWEQIIHYMLWGAVDSSERNDFEEILNWAYVHYPEESERGAYLAILDGLEEDIVSTMALRGWERWVSDKIFSDLFDKYGDDENRALRILEAAFDARKTRGVEFPSVMKYLESRYSVICKMPIEGAASLALGMSLYPDVYVPRVMALVEARDESVRPWLEKVMGYMYHDHVNNAFQVANIEYAVKFYVQLERWYPPEDCPVHERSYSPTAKDEIYMMIMHLSNRLLNEPDDVTLKVLDAELAKSDCRSLREMRKGVAERLLETRKPELVSLDILDKLSQEERPISDLSTREYNKIVRELKKDFAQSKPSTNVSMDTTESKQLVEHANRCRWIFGALEAWRMVQKEQLEDVRVIKKPFLNPPTVEWISDWINITIFGLKRSTDKNGVVGGFLAAQREGRLIKPITKRQVGWSLERALGMTINDIRKIYADWKERELKGENEQNGNHQFDDEFSDKNQDSVVGVDNDVDLAGGQHNWGGISDEENSLSHLNSIVKIGKKPSKWMKKSTNAYNKLKKQIETKPHYFSYEIFMYWVGLKLDAFVRMPKQMNFKDVIGTVGSVERIFDTLERFRK